MERNVRTRIVDMPTKKLNSEEQTIDIRPVYVSNIKKVIVETENSVGMLMARLNSEIELPTSNLLKSYKILLLILIIRCRWVPIPSSIFNTLLFWISDKCLSRRCINLPSIFRNQWDRHQNLRWFNDNQIITSMIRECSECSSSSNSSFILSWILI